MEIITITAENIENEHICCAIGNDKKNKDRMDSKKEWLKERFSEGLVFKKLDVRGKVFIEYTPIEKVWKPLQGENYMVINCLWISGQFKGKGYSVQLLNECIKDAKEKNMNGIVVVSSDKPKPYLTDKKFYLKQGFQVTDTLPPYFELLELKFNSKSESPSFNKVGNINNFQGFTFVYSNQCPFTQEYVHLLSTVATVNKINSQILKLESYKEAQKIGCPFGTFSMYYKDKFLTHELMSEKNFIKLITDLQKEY